MKTTAVRLYGEKDLRLETFDLPEIADDEILIRIISDSVCMSTYKTALQGSKHLRVPDDVAEHPVIIGHEFCAEIAQVGEKRKNEYAIGEKVIIPPVLSYLGGNRTIGYSFGDIGGCATYAVVHSHIIDNGYLFRFRGDAFFKGSLIEPASCVLRGYKGTTHLDEELKPYMNLKPGGTVGILAGCGPMGLVAIDCALHGEKKPSRVIVTDISEDRLRRATSLFSAEDAKRDGIDLIFTAASDRDELMALTGGKGYDDVFVYAPVPALATLGDSLLAFDGCLNFFAGPIDKAFSATVNFYNVHYQQHHFAGTSGSTPDDIKDIVDMIGARRINPAVMVTHIGGIDAAIDTTLNLPKIPGGKKLIYTHIQLPLTAIDEFEKRGEKDSRFRVLDSIVKAHNGLWCAEAEAYLLENF